MKDLLGKVVELRTLPGEHHGIAKVYGFQEQPSVLLEFPDGSHGTWMASLCREADVLLRAEFWQQRAEALERQLVKTPPFHFELGKLRGSFEAPRSTPLIKLIELLRHRTTYRDSGSWEDHVADAALLALPDLEVLATRCRLERQ